jgi:selT/selW/selH-like putative selenoprotein
LSEEIKTKYNVQATLVKLDGGRFEVYKNDKLIFSKLQTKKFPKHEEIFQALDAQ